MGEPDPEGQRSIFFELNGQPREVKVRDHSLAPQRPERLEADPNDPGHVAAPMRGMVMLSVEEGQRVATGDRLATIEAMKMESAVFAEVDGVIEEVVARAGTRVQTDDLVLVVRAADGGNRT